MNRSHLDALNLGLSNERMRYAADGKPIRKVWIAQMEREIISERKFLGLGADTDISDDQLLAELF